MTGAPLILVGGGGHASVVAESASLSGRPMAGFLDDAPTASLAAGGVPLKRLGVLADLAGLTGLDGAWLLAVGDLRLRASILASGVPAPAAAPVLHPAAVVSPTASLGAGVWIGPGAVVHTNAAIDRHAIVNSGAIVEHDVAIGANAHVAPGAVLGGQAHVGGGTLVGLGARVLPRVRIGAGCVIGAGAVVTDAVPDGATVVGSPARPVQHG